MMKIALFLAAFVVLFAVPGNVEAWQWHNQDQIPDEVIAFEHSLREVADVIDRNDGLSRYGLSRVMRLSIPGTPFPVDVLLGFTKPSEGGKMKDQDLLQCTWIVIKKDADDYYIFVKHWTFGSRTVDITRVESLAAAPIAVKRRLL